MSIGDRIHVVRLQNPGAPEPDSDGGFSETWTDLAARWHCRITPTAGRERATADTVTAAATHRLEGVYLEGVTTASRVLLGARVLNVVDVVNPDEAGVSLLLTCTEVLAS